MRRSRLVLSILSGIFLLYIMLALIVFKEQVFAQKELLSPAEVLILIGFCFILVFNIVSIIWLLRSKAGKALVILGGIALLLLMGDKTMADEISRELAMGWEIRGEWIILYIFLTIQLIYNALVLNLSLKNP